MTRFTPLPGSERTLLPNSRPVGPVSAGEIASITLRVRSQGDLAKLSDRAHALARMPLADRRYVSLGELDREFGAAAADLDQLEFFAHRHNLAVVRRSSVERIVTLKGRLGDFLAAFRVNLQQYDHSNGRYRGRSGPILLPEGLSRIVTGVFGFDTRPKHRTRHRALSAALAGPGGGNGEVATQFAQRYDYPADLDGTGQTIAIIELGGGYQSSDLQVFFNEIGVALPDVTWVSVDGGSDTPVVDPNSDGEVMLDIEVVGAVVPKATMAVYFAPNTEQGFQDAISTAIHDTQRNPCVLSISWGAPEDSVDAQGLQAYHEIFTAAAALGLTVCAASGDHGTADMTAPWDGQLHVNHPASDPLVLGCGGTQINPDGSEVVWNDGSTLEDGGWATGGGISPGFAVPDYQANVAVPNSLATGNPGRGVPDIALSATNYFTRVDGSEGPSGGTSAGTPLMAALIAQANQKLGKRLGQLQPFLYAQAVTGGIVTAITAGTNAITGASAGYDAASGVVWNACCGLGTPVGNAIIAALPDWQPGPV